MGPYGRYTGDSRYMPRREAGWGDSGPVTARIGREPWVRTSLGTLLKAVGLIHKTCRRVRKTPK